MVGRRLRIGYGEGGMAMDQNGSLYYADNGHQVIKLVQMALSPPSQEMELMDTQVMWFGD